MSYLGPSALWFARFISNFCWLRHHGRKRVRPMSNHSDWSGLFQFLSLYGIVDGLFNNKSHEYKNSQKSKIYHHLEEKGGVLTLPLLNSRGSLNFEMLQPIFKSLSQSFSAQRNKSRSHHKNCCKLPTHEVCAPFLCLHDVYSDAKSVFCSTIGQFFKISRRQLLEPVIFYNSWHEEKDRAQNDPDNQFILLQAPSKHGGRNFNYIQKNYAECTQL